MKKWQVVFILDASKTVEVEAETREAAEQLAWERVGNPTLCHYCAGNIDLGDPTEISEITEIVGAKE